MTKKGLQPLVGLVLIGALYLQHHRAQAQDAPPCALETGAQTQGMPSTDRIFNWVEEITLLGERKTGTEAGERAASYVKCKLESLGVQDVHFETTPSWKWEATRHSLHINGREIDSFPAAFTFVTPDEPASFTTGPNGLNAPIVDIGSGSALMVNLSDVKGKIVVFDLKFQVPLVAFTPFLDYMWDPELTVVEPASFMGNPYITNMSSVVKRLMDAGAVGFVGVLSDYFDSNKYHNEFYRRLQMTIPGLWVTKTDGAMLRAAIKTNRRTASARMVLDGSRTWVPAHAVIGVLPGKSKDTVLVTSHHDSVSSGAVEDASGVASVFAQAQIAASKPLQAREKTLMFVTMDSHFTGYQVHQAFVRKYLVEKRTPYNIVAGVTLEHVAKQGVIEKGQLVMTEQSEVLGVLHNLSRPLSKVLQKSIKSNDVRRMGTVNVNLLCREGLGIPTDASFTCATGLPTASLVSAPIYLYDSADTLDKVAKDKLQPVAKVFAELIEAMDKTPASDMGR